MPEGGAQLSVEKTIIILQQPCGLNAHACEEKSVCHLSKGKARGERRHRKDCWSAAHFSQRFGELSITHRNRRHAVDRSRKGFGINEEPKGSDDVVEGNPTHVLATLP